MKNRIAIIALALGLTNLTFGVIPSVWTINEINVAREAALEHFVGEGLGSLEQVVGYSVKLTTQKNSARAEIYYLAGNLSKTAKVFCHAHAHEGEEEIDCH